MKKTMALVLSLLMIFQMTAFSAPSAKEESSLLFNQSFNSVATNSQPIGINVVGKGARVMDFGKDNKALGYTLKQSTQLAEITASIEEKFFISFDIAAVGKINGALKIKDSSGSAFSIVRFENGKVATHNGREVAGINSKFTTVAVEANYKTSSYNLYINGKCEKADYYVSNIGIKDAAKICFELSSETGADAYLDNINIGNGKLMSSFPVDKYDPASIEYTDTTYGITDDVYLGLDFTEGKRTSAAFTHKNNILERYTDENGEGVCLFKRTLDQDYHLDVNISPYPSDSIVYQYDFKLMSQSTQFITQIKSTSANYFTHFTVANGVLTAGNAKVTLDVGNWHTVSVVYNVLEGQSDVYLDYKKIASKLQVNNLYLPEEAATWRIHVNRKTGGDDYFHVDNMLVYGGDAPRKDVKIPEMTELIIDPALSALPSENPQKSALLGRVSYHPESGVLYNGTDKTIFKPTETNGVIMVPIEFFSKAFGFETSYDSVNGTAKIGNLGLKSNSSEITGLAGTASLDAPAMADGQAFLVPLKSFAQKGLGKKVYQDFSVEQTAGMIVISDVDFVPPTGSALQELNDFTLYLRPDAQKISDDYNASPLKGVHPRYLADNEDFDRIRKDSKTDPTMIAWSKAVISHADG